MLKICLSFWKFEPQYAYKLQKTCIHENVIAYDIFVKRNLFVYKFKNIQAFGLFGECESSMIFNHSC